MFDIFLILLVLGTGAIVAVVAAWRSGARQGGDGYEPALARATRRDERYFEVFDSARLRRALDEGRPEN